MSRPAPSITTPTLDAILTGGLSVAGMGALLVWALCFDGPVDFVDGDWITLLILINATHFTASYRLLYVSREEILANRWSAIYVPAALLAILLAAAITPHRESIVTNLVFASSIYLAWHYTGQAWGMVSTFTRIQGVTLTSIERRCIRSGMRTLLGLHLLFALSGRYPPTSWIAPGDYVRLYGIVFQGVVIVAGVTLVAGAWAFWRAHRRGPPMPVRAILPWLALYLWYPFWYYVPGGFLWVQLSHALQYLPFPLRVEANRHASAAPRTPWDTKIHVALVYAGLALAGGFFLHGPPLAATWFGEGWYSTDAARTLFQGFVACVAIHHYFIDGAVWKLRNPKVRSELLGHLRGPDSAPDRA